MARKKKSTYSAPDVLGGTTKAPAPDYVQFYNQQQQQKAQQKQQQAQQKPDQPKPKKQGFLGKLVSTGKSLAKGAVAGEQKFATGIARDLPGGTADIKAQEQQGQSAENNLKFVKQQQKVGKISSPQAAKIIKNIASGASQTSKQQTQTLKEMPSKKQVALGAASTAADIATAGALPEIKSATTAAKVIPRVVANSVAGGLNAGAAGGNKKNILENAVAGAVLPEALAEGSRAITKGADKVADEVVSKTGVGSKKSAKELITNVKTQQALEKVKPTNDLEKLANDQNAKSAKTVVAELPSETELPQPKAPEPPVQTEMPQRPVEQIAEDIKQNNEHIRTITGKSPHDLVANSKEKPIPKEVQPYIDQHQSLQKEYVQATTPTHIPDTPSPEIQAVRDTNPTSPITQDTGTSKIGKSINTKAIEKGLTKTYGDLAQYDKITIKDQAKKAADLVEGDPERLRRVVNGQEKLPPGLKSTALVTAVEQHALNTGDTDLLRDLARSHHVSESSRSAQELRLAAEREPDSVSANIKKVIDARKKAAQAKGVSSKAIAKTASVIKSKVHTPTRQEWGDFIEEIKCK